MKMEDQGYAPGCSRPYDATRVASCRIVVGVLHPGPAGVGDNDSHIAAAEQESPPEVAPTLAEQTRQDAAATSAGARLRRVAAGSTCVCGCNRRLRRLPHFSAAVGSMWLRVKALRLSPWQAAATGSRSAAAHRQAHSQQTASTGPRTGPLIAAGIAEGGRQHRWSPPGPGPSATCSKDSRQLRNEHATD